MIMSQGLLGQAGRQNALEITRDVLKGDAAAAMTGLAEATGRGAEPQMVLADMLELIHLASRLAAGGGLADLPEHEVTALTTLAEDVGLPRLVRAWQIALKGHGEMAIAPDTHGAMDMILIRLAHAASLPTPADLVRKLEGQPPVQPAAAPASPALPPRPRPHRQRPHK